MAQPTFVRSVVEHTTNLSELHTFMVSIHDFAPGLVGFDTETSEIIVFDNPINYMSHAPPAAEWKRYVVGGFDTSRVIDRTRGIAVGDCTGDHYSDIVVVIHGYSTSRLMWLENPGRLGDGTVAVGWTSRPIGRYDSTSIKAGYFTQKDFLEVIAMPSIDRNIRHPVEKVAIFRRPDNPRSATDWGVSHFTSRRPYFVNGSPESSLQLPATGLDSWILASYLGIHCLYHDRTEMTWEQIAYHSPTPNTACAGKLGANGADYILATEIDGATTVAAFTNAAGDKWVRHEVDQYVQSHGSWGSGIPKTFITTADFDNDGDDEALVASMGISEREAGVHYYKATDIANGKFSKWKVAEGATTWIAVGDFTAKNKLSFAVLAYSRTSGLPGPVNYTPAIHLYSNTSSLPTPHRATTGCACNK